MLCGEYDTCLLLNVYLIKHCTWLSCVHCDVYWPKHQSIHLKICMCVCTFNYIVCVWK